MNRRRSLRRVLARQWAAFALVLFAGFAAMAVLLLYLLEDSFIDRRLREVGGTVTERSAAALPARFALYPPASAPVDIRAQVQGMREGSVREFRLPDRRYVHVLSGRTPDGAVFLLVHDVSDQLTVNAVLARAWPWLLGMAVLLALAAWAMAHAFMGRVSRQAASLVARVGAQDDAAQLRAYARETPVQEFGELAQHLAEAWEARLQSLAREHETLAFLGHELRTPLQSARTSLALLQARPDHDAAWQRLQRAVARLSRASASVLWLSAGASGAEGAEGVDPCALPPLLTALADEFAPLAAARGQTLTIHAEDPGAWPLPPEVAETVLANLLLNAIQHGGPGEIAIELRQSRLRLRNPTTASAGDGAGLGLRLVERILGRIGLRLQFSRNADAVTVTVE